MILVGLTGYMGSGKTVVGKILEFLGAKLYDSDTEAKRLMSENKSLKEQIIREFGTETYKDGELQRDVLRSIVFNNESKLQQLNNIVHPAVYEDFQFYVEKNKNSKMIIFESALLLKGEFYKLFDKIINVTTNREILIARIQRRNGFSKELTEKILSQQAIDKSRFNLTNLIEIKNNESNLILPEIIKTYYHLINTASLM